MWFMVEENIIHVKKICWAFSRKGCMMDINYSSIHSWDNIFLTGPGNIFKILEIGFHLFFFTLTESSFSDFFLFFLIVMVLLTTPWVIIVGWDEEVLIVYCALISSISCLTPDMTGVRTSVKSIRVDHWFSSLFLPTIFEFFIVTVADDFFFICLSLTLVKLLYVYVFSSLTAELRLSHVSSIFFSS